jgi:hypothetical protein
VGLDFTDEAAFRQMIDEMAAVSKRESGRLGTRLLWLDSSGAAVAMFLEETGSGLACAKPTFAARSRLMVRGPTQIDDPQGCSFCAITTVEVIENEDPVYPLAVELDDIHLGPLGGPVEVMALSVTGFGESITVWSDKDAYEASDKGEAPMFAAKSLIPSGLFTPGGERPIRAEAIITGIIDNAERRVNRRSVKQFEWCQVDTYGGTLDLVLERRPLAPGQVVQGTFWLVAHRTDDCEVPRDGQSWFRRKRKR